MPNASAPQSTRKRATWPGPQPRSQAGPSPRTAWAKRSRSVPVERLILQLGIDAPGIFRGDPGVAGGKIERLQQPEAYRSVKKRA